MDRNSDQPRGRGRPATGKTPKRYFRAEDALWTQIVQAAEVDGTTASEYIRKVLARDSRRVLKQKT